MDAGTAGSVVGVASLLALGLNIGYILLAVPMYLGMKEHVTRLTEIREEVGSVMEKNIGEQAVLTVAKETMETDSKTGISRETTTDEIQDVSKTPEVRSAPEVLKAPVSSDKKVSSVKGPERRMVRARAKFKGTKDNQMSFEKGDLIEVLRDSGKWYVGILRRSKEHDITGKKMYVPSNYVENIAKQNSLSE